MNHRHRPCLLAAMLLVATACVHVREPAAFDINRAATTGEHDWWRAVGGKPLDALMQEALANSPTLDVLAARLRQAEAESRLQAAPAQPNLEATAARNYGRRQEFETGGRPADVMNWSGMASFSWEIDFWGRVRHLRAGAREAWTASQFDYLAGQLLLTTDLAMQDTRRRRYGAEEAFVQRAWEANDNVVKLLQEKFDAGIIETSLLDRQRAEGESLRREIDDLQRQRLLSEHALDRLIGRRPGSEWPSPPPLGDLPTFPTVLNTEWLLGRPDLQAAGARVAAAWHLSRAAALDLLPKVKLSGLAAGETFELKTSVDEWITRIGPSLEIPLWDPERRIDAQIASAEAEAAAAEFRERFWIALEETAAAYTHLHAQERLWKSARASADSLRSIFERTLERFQNGLSSQLEVLEDERRWVETEQDALAAHAAQLAAWIDLVKALGGSLPESSSRL